MKKNIVISYNFNELTKEAKDVALEKHREFVNDTGSPFAQDIIDDYETKLEKYGFMNAEICYSGFWSQGDGASFDADLDVFKFCKECHFETKFKKLLNYLKKTDAYINIKTAKTSYANMYSHEKTRHMDFDELEQIDIDDKKFDELSELAEKLTEYAEDVRLEFCREIYNKLEKEYEHSMSEESIIQSIEDNEYQFLANGKIF